MKHYMTIGLANTLSQSFEDGKLCTIDGERIIDVHLCRYWVEIHTGKELTALNYEDDYCTGILVNGIEMGTIEETPLGWEPQVQEYCTDCNR